MATPYVSTQLPSAQAPVSTRPNSPSKPRVRPSGRQPQRRPRTPKFIEYSLEQVAQIIWWRVQIEGLAKARRSAGVSRELFDAAYKRREPVAVRQLAGFVGLDDKLRLYCS